MGATLQDMKKIAIGLDAERLESMMPGIGRNRVTQATAEAAARQALKKKLMYGAGAAGLLGLGGYGLYRALSGDDEEAVTPEDRMMLEEMRQQMGEV